MPPDTMDGPVGVGILVITATSEALNQLQRLGYDVTLNPAAATA